MSDPQETKPAAPATPAPMAPASRPNPKKRRILLIVAAVILCVGFVYWLHNLGIEETDDAFTDAHIVAISPKVSGYIKTMNVADNQPVKENDIILTIDPTDYQIALDRAMADQAMTEAQLVAAQQNLASVQISAPSNLDAAESQVASAEAGAQKATLDLKRLQGLDNTVRSRQQLDDANAADKTARAALDDARAKFKGLETVANTIAAAEANVKQLEAQVAQAKAAVHQAQENLDDTTLRAPFDGNITRRNVEVGTYLQPGQQVMNMVGTEFWVVANFKETQLENMHPGNKVDIHLDAYDKTLHGKVDSIQAGTGARFSAFPAENATGNFVKIIQRVPVKIVLDGPLPDGIKLGAGMSVVPRVHVD